MRFYSCRWDTSLIIWIHTKLLLKSILGDSQAADIISETRFSFSLWASGKKHEISQMKDDLQLTAPSSFCLSFPISVGAVRRPVVYLCVSESSVRLFWSIKNHNSQPWNPPRSMHIRDRTIQTDMKQMDAHTCTGWFSAWQCDRCEKWRRQTLFFSAGSLSVCHQSQILETTGS